MSASSMLLRATAPPLSPTHSIPPAPPPPTPPPPRPRTPLPAPPSVKLVAVVHLLRDPTLAPSPHSSSSPPLHFAHTYFPFSSNATQHASAKSALLAAVQFIFPTDAAAAKCLSARPATAPPPRVAPSLTPSPSPHQQASQPPSQPALHSQLRSAKVLPLSATALFNALHVTNTVDVPAPPPAPTRTPARIARHRRNVARQTPDSAASPRRRANSLPRQPSSSPRSRSRSAGIPPISAAPTPSLPPLDLNPPPYPTDHTPHALLPFLMAARAHAFAVTAGDGSRQYAFCRPLSALHALVVLADCSHTARFVSALEATVDRFASLLLIDAPAHRGLYRAQCPLSHCLSPPFRRASILCAPDVAHYLCLSTVRAMASPQANGSEPCTMPQDESKLASDALRMSPLSDFAAHDCKPLQDAQHTHASNSTLCLTPSSTSSGRVTPGSALFPADTLTVEQITSSAAAATFPSDDTSARTLALFNEVANIDDANSAATEDMRGHLAHLADAYVLFSNFSVRSIVVMITALLEERHVCIVGPSSSLVSRAVLAVKDLLYPFEWPHILSPILPSHHLQVLGAPIPFLVGILDEFYPQALELPLVEGLVFANVQTGKVAFYPEGLDISRHIPRRLRNRLERRLARVKSACTRSRLRLNRSETSLSTFMSALSSNSDQFDDDAYITAPPMSRPATLQHEDYHFKSQSSAMWRSRPQNRLNKLTGTGQSSLDTFISTETLTALHKAMCKFFAELLADLPVIEGTGGDHETTTNGIVSSPPPIASIVLSPASISKKDSRTLLRSFAQTQMYMQWERDENRDATFGIIPSDGTRHRRKRAADARDRTTLRARGGVDDASDAEEDVSQFVPSLVARNTLQLPRFKKTRPITDFLDEDAEDPGILSGSETVAHRRSNPFANMRILRRQRNEMADDDAAILSQGNPLWFGRSRAVVPDVTEALFQDEDLGVMSGPEPRMVRKSKNIKVVRKSNRARRRRNRNGPHVNFADEIVSSVDVYAQEMLTDAEVTVGETGEDDETQLRHSTASTEPGRNSDVDIGVRRPWLFLRLPGSPWTSTRESSSRDGDSRGPSCDKTRVESSDENEAANSLHEHVENDIVDDVVGVHSVKKKAGEVKTASELSAEDDLNSSPGWKIVRQWQMRRYKNVARA